MNHLRKFYIIFGLALCFTIKSHGHLTKVSTLYCQNMSLKIKGGQVILTKTSPNIYSLVRVRGQNDSNQTISSLGGLHVTLESIATGKSICMNSKGKVYSFDGKKFQKSERSRRRENSEEKPLLPKNCYFVKHKFSSFSTYRPAVGLFSPVHSNTTTGLFVTFKRNGTVHGELQNFSTLNSKENVWVKIEMVSVTSPSLEEFLDRTNFAKSSNTSDNYNKRVRNCIRKKCSLFGNETTSISGQHSKRSLLKSVIPKCKRKVEIKVKNKKEANEEIEKAMLFEKVSNNEIAIDKVDNRTGKNSTNYKLSLIKPLKS